MHVIMSYGKQLAIIFEYGTKERKVQKANISKVVDLESVKRTNCKPGAKHCCNNIEGI